MILFCKAHRSSDITGYLRYHITNTGDQQQRLLGKVHRPLLLPLSSVLGTLADLVARILHAISHGFQPITGLFGAGS
jgi:hypothetical protein